MPTNNALRDPDRRPPGTVAITCSCCDRFVAWCSPPPPLVPVRCSDCPPAPDTLREVTR